MSQAGVITEKIWLNFMPDRPYWHACAGPNFTDRQRISAMRPGERLAVLAAIMAVETE